MTLSLRHFVVTPILILIYTLPTQGQSPVPESRQTPSQDPFSAEEKQDLCKIKRYATEEHFYGDGLLPSYFGRPDPLGRGMYFSAHTASAQDGESEGYNYFHNFSTGENIKISTGTDPYPFPDGETISTPGGAFYSLSALLKRKQSKVGNDSKDSEDGKKSSKERLPAPLYTDATMSGSYQSTAVAETVDKNHKVLRYMSDASTEPRPNEHRFGLHIRDYTATYDDNGELLKIEPRGAPVLLCPNLKGVGLDTPIMSKDGTRIAVVNYDRAARRRITELSRLPLFTVDLREGSSVDHSMSRTNLEHTIAQRVAEAEALLRENYGMLQRKTRIYKINPVTGDCTLEHTLPFVTGKVDFDFSGSKVAFHLRANHSRSGWPSTPDENDLFNSYELDLNTQSLRQLSGEIAGNDYYPSYMRDGSIVSMALGDINVHQGSFRIYRDEDRPAWQTSQAIGIACQDKNTERQFHALAALGQLWTEVCVAGSDRFSDISSVMLALNLPPDHCKKLVEKGWRDFIALKRNQKVMQSAQLAVSALTRFLFGMPSQDNDDEESSSSSSSDSDDNEGNALRKSGRIKDQIFFQLDEEDLLAVCPKESRPDKLKLVKGNPFVSDETKAKLAGRNQLIPDHCRACHSYVPWDNPEDLKTLVSTQPGKTFIEVALERMNLPPGNPLRMPQGNHPFSDGDKDKFVKYLEDLRNEKGL